MRAERKQMDKPEENAGKKRRMERVSRMVKSPRQLAAAALVLAAVLCACTSAGAGGEGETSAPPEGASTPPVVSAGPSQPAERVEPSETPETLRGNFQALVWDMDLPIDQWRQNFESEEAFLAAFGFAGVEPRFEHSHSEENGIWGKQGNGFVTQTVRIYYNEETGAGCAVEESIEESDANDAAQDGKRVYGYAFMETQLVAEDSWEQWDRWKTDWFTIPHREWIEMEDYQERYTYDEDGRLSGFSADGICPSPWTNEDGRNPIYAASFTYREDGTLQYRHFVRYLEGSYQMIQYSWFDELGRVSYEHCYVTHGYEEFFYIYTDDGTAPAYCLYIDEWGNGVIFGKY